MLDIYIISYNEQFLDDDDYLNNYFNIDEHLNPTFLSSKLRWVTQIINTNNITIEEIKDFVDKFDAVFSVNKELDIIIDLTN